MAFCRTILTSWLSFVIFFFNLSYSLFLCSRVGKTNTIAMWVYIVFCVGWNYLTWKLAKEESGPIRCHLLGLSSCFSFTILMGLSFYFVMDYHYNEFWQNHPDKRYDFFAPLKAHQFGLVSLTSSIIVVHFGKWKLIMRNKRDIYKILMDLIDIYAMAKFLELDARTCTLVKDNVPYSIYNISESTWPPMKITPTRNITNITGYHNDTVWPQTTTTPTNMSYHNITSTSYVDISTISPQTIILTYPTTAYICTNPINGSWFGWTKIFLHIFCSLSFLLFLIIFFQGLSTDEYGSSSSFVKFRVKLKGFFCCTTSPRHPILYNSTYSLGDD